MIVLGIESSCDETAASVVRDHTQVLSSVVASQTKTHAEYGGVVPEIASRLHEINILPVIDQALDEANITYQDLDAIAVGHRPGLVGSLLVGLSAAKALSWSLGKPLIGVDHVHAHLYAPFLDAPTPPAFPALGLVVSGGHTSLYHMSSPTKLTRLGATIDDAIGEAFDKAASILSLPYPGGPHIDQLAQHPEANDRLVDFPISRLSKDSLDFSYSGLKTALLYATKGKPNPPKLPGKPQRLAEAPPELTEQRTRDLAASFQRAAIRALTIKAQRALDQHPGMQSIIIGGGVSANTLLHAEFARVAHENTLTLHIPEMQYCIDNAAMIAALGSVLFESGQIDDLRLEATPTTAC
ncbi:MAG: tRNA (adenosine(37)-N6)-threonylcarbamoyltransferase complex transferase subunit TsaD [Phycisphaerales bacterium]